MDFIPLGTIVNTHGLKGTLKVKSSTDFKELRYKKGETLYIAFRDEMIPVTVDSFRTVKGLDYIDFVEFTDINQCEKFKGSTLNIHPSQQHELDTDEFYYDELIGMKVVGETLLGIVVAVREVPQGELLVVKTSEKQVLIPFSKQFVLSVDKESNTITIIEWEGLI
jgi:16S rRNA processing protein RimM